MPGEQIGDRVAGADQKEPLGTLLGTPRDFFDIKAEVTVYNPAQAIAPPPELPSRVGAKVKVCRV